MLLISYITIQSYLGTHILIPMTIATSETQTQRVYMLLDKLFVATPNYSKSVSSKSIDHNK